MTHIELRDLLLNRIGWRQPLDSVVTIDATNLTSQSGRFFQDEHPSVTITNIKSSMLVANGSDEQVNLQLTELRKQAIILVLADVFRISDLQEDILTNRENIFDNAISKRMAIIVGEMILTSTRSNRNERIAKEFMQKLFFELNGNSDSSSARANDNFPTYVGLKSRYGAEIKELKDLFEQDDALDVFTFRLPDYNGIDEFPYGLDGQALLAI